jgi:kumamolisin
MKKNLKSRIVISTLVALGGTGCGKANSSLQAQSAGKILCSVKNQLKNHGNYLDSVDTKPVQLKPLYGHVPLESKLSQDLGPVKDHELFEITVALGYRDSTKLQTELDDIYNPSSPKFHQFLSPNDFKDRFAPTEAQILQVKTALVANGFTLSDSGSSGILILASAPARTIEEFFHTEIHHFKDPKSHRIYSAPTYELQVPSDLPIRWVHGLDKQFQVRHHSIISTLEGTPSAKNQG